MKTRLARQIGVVQATAFYRHAASAVIRRLAASSRWQTWLATAPDATIASRFWPHHLPRRAQGTGDLGARMQRIMDWPGRGPVMVIGTDIPAITPSHIAEAFRALARGRTVLGPTPDGGYWLVGLARSPRIERPFANVRWSSEYALADTEVNVAGLAIAHAANLSDVDSADEWRVVHNWSGRLVLPARELD